MTTKPVILSDLDDTLFQTKRKMTQEQALTPFRAGAVDRTLQPRSFMTEEQAMLIDSDPDRYYRPAYFGDGMKIAVAADNTALKASIDGALRALDADGTLADLALRFFPESLY